MELRRLMGRSDAGLIPITELRKITYGVLRGGLLANYEERGNNIELRATGAETIGGLPALDSFFGFSSENPGPPVTHITTDTGREFTKRQLAAGYSAATINRSLACLRRMLRIAYEDGKMQAGKIHRTVGYAADAFAGLGDVSVLVWCSSRRSSGNRMDAGRLKSAAYPSRRRSNEKFRSPERSAARCSGYRF